MNVNDLLDEFDNITFVKENPFGITMIYFNRFIHVNWGNTFKHTKKLKEKPDWIGKFLHRKKSIG